MASALCTFHQYISLATGQRSTCDARLLRPAAAEQVAHADGGCGGDAEREADEEKHAQRQDRRVSVQSDRAWSTPITTVNDRRRAKQAKCGSSVAP